MEQICIPDSAVKYILLQRTGYLPKIDKVIKAINRILSLSFGEKAIDLISRVYSDKIKMLYANDIRNEYHSIKPFLPETCNSVLDIGCGVAGIDIFLADNYDNKDLKIYLLDKTKTENSIWYGFHQEGAFYNSLEVAKNLLIKNGISQDNITTLEVSKQKEIDVDKKIDLVVSLISWGFHYPVETYLEQVNDILNKNGVVILDIRNNTSGLETIKKYLPKIQYVYNKSRFSRIVATRG
jgi:SAM-dependent methyltransferase